MLISRLTICDAPAISLISARLTEATDVRERAAEQPSYRLCVAFDHHLLYNLPTTSHPEQPGGRLIGLGGEQRRRCIQVEHATKLADLESPLHRVSTKPARTSVPNGKPRHILNALSLDIVSWETAHVRECEGS